TQTAGATDWIGPTWRAPAAIPGPGMTPTFVTRGDICLTSSNPSPLKPYSKAVKPVALVPGRARLSTNPPPTGSTVVTNTIGTERDARCNGPTVALPVATITSGASATTSTAYLRMRPASPPAHRASLS